MTALLEAYTGQDTKVPNGWVPLSRDLMNGGLPTRSRQLASPVTLITIDYIAPNWLPLFVRQVLAKTLCLYVRVADMTTQVMRDIEIDFRDLNSV
jgi:hypothetical protein